MSSEEILKLYDASNKAGQQALFNIIVDEHNREAVKEALKEDKKE